MRFAGIDVASKTHVIAVVNENGEALVKPTPFGEDAKGYETLFAVLGAPNDILVALEATGHYGKNLFAALHEKGFDVALLNPLRTRRFAQEDLARAKSDSIDALAIARFAAQKRPASTPAFDTDTDTLRQLVCVYDRINRDRGDRLRQLHRLVHLSFPEFTRHVRTLSSQRATAILGEYPNAKAFDETCFDDLAALRCDDHHHIVGRDLARALIDEARTSVGRHHTPAYTTEMQYLCDDADLFRRRLVDLDAEIERRVKAHPVASLLATINGLGVFTVARIVAAVGDPARFRNGAALAAYAGVVPGTKESGLRRSGRASLCPLGNARLRSALYMATLGAVRRNPWLTAYYQRLRAKGKLPKVALGAAMRKLLTAVYSVAKHRRPFVAQLPGNSVARQ